MALKTKPIQKKSFGDEVREFFGMGIKKPIDVSKQDPEKTIGDLHKAGGKVPRVKIEERKRNK